MSFDKYEQKRAKPFDLYYDQFLQNSLARRPYFVRLAGGDSRIGRPTAGSIADPRDPDVRFHFRAEDGNVYRIPFSEIEDAQELVECRVRTINTQTEGGGDFSLYVATSEVGRVLESTLDPETLLGHLPARRSHIKDAPQGTYKSITIEHTDFSILTHQPGPVGMLALKISRA